MTPVALYMGAEHECGYLPGKWARMIYVAPRVRLDKARYTELAASGFRRSGDWVYRPACEGCSACVPVRLPVAEFEPNRAQRRTMKINADLVVVQRPAVFDRRHYRLYQRYLRARHADGQMSESSPEEYLQFLSCGWGDTAFYEFLMNGDLVAVAVVDHLDDGLSAVYTFYDPDQMHRSLGTFAVLWQIGEARRRGLPWLYLGFWISACRKMAYKGAFRPLQALIDSRWVRLDKGKNGLD